MPGPQIKNIFHVLVIAATLNCTFHAIWSMGKNPRTIGLARSELFGHIADI